MNDTVRLRLDLAYDGSDFSGWAAQPGRRTVQAQIEDALSRVLRLSEPARLTVAGRTDAGVHATGQVAHLDLPAAAWPADGDRVLRSLAGVLPPDVRVHALAPAPPGFDARFSALWRRYRYRVCDAPAGADPLRRHDTLWYARPLATGRMNAAARLLLGEHDFYVKIFRDLGIAYQPMRWATDFNPALLGGDSTRDQVVKQARVLELINAYRVRGHLIADIDPLNALPIQYHPELDIETYGLTIWDLDREFITGGLGGKESATLREILDILRRAYCGKVGTEYRHIQSKEQKVWLRDRIRVEFVYPEPLTPETKKALLDAQSTKKALEMNSK